MRLCARKVPGGDIPKGFWALDAYGSWVGWCSSLEGVAPEWRARSGSIWGVLCDDCGTTSDLSSSYEPGSEAAFPRENPQYGTVCSLGEKSARFTQLKPLKQNIANSESLAAQVVQRCAARHDVSPGHVGRERDCVLARKILDVLTLH